MTEEEAILKFSEHEILYEEFVHKYDKPLSDGSNWFSWFKLSRNKCRTENGMCSTIDYPSEELLCNHRDKMSKFSLDYFNEEYPQNNI